MTGPCTAILAAATAWVPNQAGVWPVADRPVPYCLSAESQNTDLTPAQVEAEMQAGIDLWLRPEQGGSLVCTSFSMERRSGACDTDLDPGNPVVSIYFESDWEMGPRVLGFTLSRIRTGSDCGRATDDTGTSHVLPCRVGTDIALNDADVAWGDGSSGGAEPIRAILGHEVGHLLGLGHCNDNATCGPGEALMFARYAPGTAAALQSDDREGACALYPAMDLPLGSACDADDQCANGRCFRGSCQDEPLDMGMPDVGDPGADVGPTDTGGDALMDRPDDRLPPLTGSCRCAAPGRPLHWGGLGVWAVLGVSLLLSGRWRRRGSRRPDPARRPGFGPGPWAAGSTRKG